MIAPFRQTAMMAAACFRPAAAATVAGAAAYAAYLAWLALGLGAELGTTASVHLLAATATLGAWVGGCTARVRSWSNSALVPGYRSAATVPALVLAVAGLAGNALVAWSCALDVWMFVAFGLLALSGSMVGGLLFPGAAVYGHMGMWLVAIAGRFSDRDAVDLAGLAPTGTWIAAVVCGIGLLCVFASPGRAVRPASPGGVRLPGVLRRGRRVWEPSFVRVASVFGVLAVGAALVQRVLGGNLEDGTWMVLIGGLCANTGATGASVALPRGPLAGAARLFLLGAARRRGVGRRVQGKIAGDAVSAVAVFGALALAFGVDLRLVEMVLVGFACSSLYLAAASGVRWLMASRLSGLLATPVVVGLALAAWEFGSWGLPAAAAFWIAAVAAAVFAGGIGIGRLDFDLGLKRETTQQ